MPCSSTVKDHFCCVERNGTLRDISKQQLGDIRIIQKNLIYVIGLAPSISYEGVKESITIYFLLDFEKE